MNGLAGAPSAPPNLGADAAHRWWHAAGIWLGIGASPAALVLGAQLAERRGGPLPVVVLAVSVLVALALLAGQGRIGLLAPHGDNGTLAKVLPNYICEPQRVVVSLLLVAAMIGWLAFNVGLGGAAVASLTATSQMMGVVVFGLPLLLLALTRIRRWNVVAVAATASALVLTGHVAAASVQNPAAQVPVTVHIGDPTMALADLAGVIGYVSVISVRGPDFTAGMRGPGDLAACIALLVIPLVAVTVLGALMWSTTGSSDLIAELERSQLGTALVAFATVAPALTAFLSGGLALTSFTRASYRFSVVVVAVPGLLLGGLGFHQQLLPLLAALGAALPALVVPMGVEARARRRGSVPRAVPALTWIPAAAVAVALTCLQVLWAPVVGLILAAAAVAAWRWSCLPRITRRGVRQ